MAGIVYGRSKVIGITVTPEEHQKIVDAATAAKLKISDYGRERLLAGLENNIKSEEKKKE